jgi:hypothetical protein
VSEAARAAGSQGFFFFKGNMKRMRLQKQYALKEVVGNLAPQV